MRKIIIEVDEDDMEMVVPCKFTVERWIKAIRNGILVDDITNEINRRISVIDKNLMEDRFYQGKKIAFEDCLEIISGKLK